MTDIATTAEPTPSTESPTVHKMIRSREEIDSSYNNALLNLGLRERQSAMWKEEANEWHLMLKKIEIERTAADQERAKIQAHNAEIDAAKAAKA